MAEASHRDMTITQAGLPDIRFFDKKLAQATCAVLNHQYEKRRCNPATDKGFLTRGTADTGFF